MSSQSQSSSKEKDFKIGNYLIRRTLGRGTFGKVKLGVYLPTKEKVAIKILEKNKIQDKDDKIRVKREFEMLTKFNHINVILVTEIFETLDSYYSVMEYCEGGELFNYIVKKRRLSEEESAFFFYQLINGLEYIHSLKMVHRDLKPENLLLTHDHILKIIDFGLSNYFSKKSKLLSTPCGSPCYASPEMVSGNKYNGFKIDIWSSGIILYAMLCGYLPFEDKDNDELFKKILECKLEFPRFLSFNSKDLIKKILVTNPDKRIGIEDIKIHPFFLKGKAIFAQNFRVKEVHNLSIENDLNYMNTEEGNNKRSHVKSSDFSASNNIADLIGGIDEEENNNVLRKNHRDNNLRRKNENKEKGSINSHNNNIKITEEGGNEYINNKNTYHQNTKSNNKLSEDFGEKVSKTEPNVYIQKNISNNKESSNNKKIISPKQKKNTIKQTSSNTISQISNTNLSNISNYININSMRTPFSSSSLARKQTIINSRRKPNNITIKNTVINLNMISPNIFLASYNKRSFSKPNSNNLNNSAKMVHMINKSERKKPDLKFNDILSNNYIESIIKTQENYQNKTNRKNETIHFNNTSAKNELSLSGYQRKQNKIKSMKLGEFCKNNLKTNKKNIYSINTISNTSLNGNVSRHTKLSSYQTTSTSIGKNIIKNNKKNSKSKSKSKQSIDTKVKSICIKDILKRLKK